MSWAEVKKLNSDPFTPLNIANLINHIDLIGDSYVGSSDEAVMLLKSNGLYSHEVARTVMFDLLRGDTTTGAAMREYIDSKLSASTGVGAWLALIGDIDNAALVACNDMTAIVASETAMTAIAASETAMTILDAGNKIIPDMTSNTAPEGVAAASSVYAGYYAYMLFDRGGSIFATAQGNYANQWVSYTFPNRVLVYRGEIERLGIAGATPKNYILQYSEDGISWGNAASGDLPSSAGLTEFTCTRSKAVRYWRFFFPESYGTTYIHVAEAQMYGREFV